MVEGRYVEVGRYDVERVGNAVRIRAGRYEGSEFVDTGSVVVIDSLISPLIKTLKKFEK